MIKATGISAEEAEACDALVCMPLKPGQPLILPDNLTGICAYCRTAVQHRPDAPKKPARICVACALLQELPPKGSA